MAEASGICGAICDTCPLFVAPNEASSNSSNQPSCPGCVACAGKVFWSVEHFGGSCPIFDCARTKHGYKDCGECTELPCKLFHELKDPSMTEEEHKLSIETRVNYLKNKN